jgi:hypothetical protein
VEVSLDIEVASHVRTTEPKFAWRPENLSKGFRGSHRHDPGTGDWSQTTSVPELETDRDLRNEHNVQKRL